MHIIVTKVKQKSIGKVEKNDGRLPPWRSLVCGRGIPACGTMYNSYAMRACSAIVGEFPYVARERCVSAGSHWEST